MIIVLDFFQEPLLFEIGDDLFPAGEAVKARVGSSRLVHDAGIVHDLEARQVVAIADLVIVAIMGGRDLQGACAEFPLDMVVENHRDDTVGQRQPDAYFLEMGVAFVIRVHGNGGVAQHGLGAGGGDDHVAGAVGIGVADMVELARLVLVLDLVIGKGGVAAGAPVDDIVALVDESFLVEADKDGAHRPRQPFVHGEAFPVPVAGAAKVLELVDDGAAFFLAPLPDALDELLPAEIVPVLALVGELALHHILGGDAGVVCPRHPEGVAAAHPLVANQDILHGVVQGVADMEHACDVGRRDDDGKRRFPLLHHCLEVFLLKPFFIPAGLDLFELVRLCQLGAGSLVI